MVRMIKKLKFVALICARKGSKGVKNKNIKLFDGKPLIAWSILKAKKIKKISTVFVSTDSKKIREISLKYGAKVPFLRPKRLATDNSPEWKSWQHAIKTLNKKKIYFDNLVVLPVTSPLRDEKDILKCLNLYEKKKKNVITYTEAKRNPYFNMVVKKKGGNLEIINNKKKYINRQLAPRVYDVSTVCYVFKVSDVIQQNHLYSKKVVGVEIPRKRSIDIDDEMDFNIALLIKKKLIS